MSSATAGALAGRRVLEIADESGVYCGKLLADMGADVVKIEPPGRRRHPRVPRPATAATACSSCT